VTEPSAPVDLHLATPVGRTLLLTALLALNLPFWVLVPTFACLLDPLLAFVLVVLGLAVSACFAGAVASRFGRIGGNLSFDRRSAVLDEAPVVGLTNWSIEQGWIEVRTHRGPQVRFGTPDAISDAVHRVAAFPGVDCDIRDRVDGFVGTSHPRAARLDALTGMAWGAVAVMLGFIPFALIGALASPSSLLCSGILLLLGLLVIALPSAAIGSHLTVLYATWPAVTLELTGNILEIQGPLRTTRITVHDPAGIQFEEHPAGTRMTFPTHDGPVHVVCTRPFAAAVKERLLRVRPLDGDAGMVPDALNRVRAGGVTE
jgi:hypothetical protein